MVNELFCGETHHSEITVFCNEINSFCCNKTVFRSNITVLDLPMTHKTVDYTEAGISAGWSTVTHRDAQSVLAAL